MQVCRFRASSLNRCWHERGLAWRPWQRLPPRRASTTACASRHCWQITTPRVTKLRAKLDLRTGELQFPEVILAVDARVLFIAWTILGRIAPTRWMAPIRGPSSTSPFKAEPGKSYRHSMQRKQAPSANIAHALTPQNGVSDVNRNISLINDQGSPPTLLLALPTLTSCTENECPAIGEFNAACIQHLVDHSQDQRETAVRQPRSCSHFTCFFRTTLQYPSTP